MAKSSGPHKSLLFKKMVNGEPVFKRKTFPDTLAGGYHALKATKEMENRGYELLGMGGVRDAAQRSA